MAGVAGAVAQNAEARVETSHPEWTWIDLLPCFVVLLAPSLNVAHAYRTICTLYSFALLL